MGTDMIHRFFSGEMILPEKKKAKQAKAVVEDRQRVESVAEHSWRVALMALLLRNEFPETDIDRVVGMCLVHDLGECFTGDIKLEALIQHNESPLDTWAENEYELNRTYAFDTVVFSKCRKKYSKRSEDL